MFSVGRHLLGEKGESRTGRELTWVVSRVEEREMEKEARRMAKQAKLAEAKAKQQHRVRQDHAGDVASYIGGANAQFSSTRLCVRIVGNRDTS